MVKSIATMTTSAPHGTIMRPSKENMYNDFGSADWSRNRKHVIADKRRGIVHKVAIAGRYGVMIIVALVFVLPIL